MDQSAQLYVLNTDRILTKQIEGFGAKMEVERPIIPIIDQGLTHNQHPTFYGEKGCEEQKLAKKKERKRARKKILTGWQKIKILYIFVPNLQKNLPFS